MSKAKMEPLEPIVITATVSKPSANYNVFKLPQSDKSDRDAPAPDETGALYLSLKKYPQLGKVKKLVITAVPE